MKRIDLSSQPPTKSWSMQFMDETNYDTLYNENVAVYKADGSPLMFLIKNAFSPENLSNAWACLKKINIKTDNRSTASGVTSRPRRKLDGEMQKTMRVPRGWEVHSGTIGFFEREVRRPFCHACSWNLAHPQEFAKLLPLLQSSSKYFSDLVPDRYAVQKSFVDKTHPDFVIKDTVYTTLTVNKNFRTAAHLDAGDLETGFSNMAVFKDGIVKGGNLVLPNYRIAAQLDNNDLILFDAHEWHGNTQVLPISEGATRCSVVMYYRTKMQHCKSVAEELARVKMRKPGDPLFDL